MYEIFEQLCRNMGITPYKFCKDMNVSTSTISTWKTKNTECNPKLAKKVCEYFGVSRDYLMTGKEPEFDNLSDEMAIMLAKIQKDTELAKALQKYFAMSDAHKKHVLETIDLLSR